MILLPILAQAAVADADCADPQTQTQMNICSCRDYQQADRTLNEAWDAAASVARRQGQFDGLLDAQRKWLAFRDAHCEAVAGPREGGGSIRPLLMNMCLTEVTRTRTGQLLELAEEY